MSAIQAAWHYVGAGSVVFTDGTAETALSHTLQLDQGNWSMGPLPELLQEEVEVVSRGRVVGVVPGGPVFPEGSVTGQVSEFSDTTDGTLMDFLFATTGTPYADRVSKVADDYFFHCDVEYHNGDDVLKFTDCRVLVNQYTEGDPSTIDISIRCRGEVYLNGTLICARIGSESA